MAVYKVIQDVEAEDHILGPLSLKQLIFAAVSAGTIFIAFKVVTSTGVIYTAIPFLPVIFVFGLLAAPLGRDQPTEMWLAAQIRFYTKPRKRLWDQSDIKQLVNITAPKREEKHYTDGLSQTEVKSRLKALASTLDSRGWAVKNVDVNEYAPSAYGQLVSDRLIDPSSLPQAVSDIDIRASDDIMDVTNNETAQHFDELMQASGVAHRNAVLEKFHKSAEQEHRLSQATPPQDYWFMHQSTAPRLKQGETMFGQSIVQPKVSDNDDLFEPTETSEDEQKIIERARRQKEQEQLQYSAHHKVILTPAQQELLDKQKKEELIREQQEQARIAEQEAKQAAKKAKQEEKTRLSKADTIELANANLKVSTIAGLAHHKIDEKKEPDEIVIKLR